MKGLKRAFQRVTVAVMVIIMLSGWLPLLFPSAEHVGLPGVLGADGQAADPVADWIRQLESQGSPCSYAASGQGLTIERALPSWGDVTVADQSAAGQVIEMGALQVWGDPGRPMLPVWKWTLLVPSGADGASAHVSVAGTWTPVSGSFDLCPGSPFVTDGPTGQVIAWGSTNAGDVKDGRDMSVYGQAGWYPADPALTVANGCLRQFSLVTAVVSPLRYNPVTGVLEQLTDARVTLSVGLGSAATVSGPVDADDRALLNRTVDNPDAIDVFYGSAPQAAPGYAIITTNAIVSQSTALSSFVADKTSQGYGVWVVTEGPVEDDTHYGAGTWGDQRANNVRAWLRNHYLEQNIQYALLVGNPDPTPAGFSSASSLPMKVCWPEAHDSTGDEVPTDMFFAELSGTWDLDGDGYYGEEDGDIGAGGIDQYCEVNVGRVPYYGVISDLDAILRGAIQYRHASGTGWRADALIAAAVSNFVESGVSRATFGADWGEQEKNLVQTSGGQATTLYEKQGCYNNGMAYALTPCTMPLTEANLVSAWQGGSYGFVSWWAHGWSEGSARKTWDGDTSNIGVADDAEVNWHNMITSSDIAQLNGARPSFVFQVSCQNARPEDSGNLSYTLLRSGVGIGTFGGTRTTWYYSGPWTPATRLDGDNASYSYLLLQQMDGAGATAGRALSYCRQETVVDMWPNALDYNLYGDPSLGVASVWVPPSIVTTTLPAAKVGSAYGPVTLSAVGGTQPYHWTASLLPAGVGLSTDGVFRGIPSQTGVYQVSVTVTDSSASPQSASASFDLLVEDAWEPDNDVAHASLISTDGTLQHHASVLEDDEDWVKFTAMQGVTYSIDTLHREANARPALELIGPSGTLRIDRSSSDESRIDFECPGGKMGTYYVRVWNDDGKYGSETGYDLRVQPALQVTLSNSDNGGADYGLVNVLNHVTVSVTRSGIPVAGATVNVDYGNQVLTTGVDGRVVVVLQHASGPATDPIEVTTASNPGVDKCFWTIDSQYNGGCGLVTVRPRDENGYCLTHFRLRNYFPDGGWWWYWDSGPSNTRTLPYVSGAVVATASASTPGGPGYVFTLQPNVPAGSEVVLTPSAATDCVPVTATASLDGSSLSRARVYLRNEGYATQTDTFAAVMDSRGTSQAYVTPGVYTVAVVQANDAVPSVWLTQQHVSVMGPASTRLAALRSQLGLLSTTFRDGANDPADYGWLYLQGAGIRATSTYGRDGSVLLSPGTYQEDGMELALWPDEGTSEYVDFACNARHSVTAGSSERISVGGPLAVTITTPSVASFSQNITTKFSVADLYGHRLSWVGFYTAADLGLQGSRPSQAPDGVLAGSYCPHGSPATSEPASAGHQTAMPSSGWSYQLPLFVVQDSSGGAQVSRQDRSLDSTFWYGYSWTVPASAPTGTWHVLVTLDTGLYAGIVRADQPFQVGGSVAYTLTTVCSPSSGGAITRNPDVASYPSGTVVTLTVTPATGYTFTGWSGDLTGTTNPATLTMTGNKTVTATFAPLGSLSLAAGWNLVSVPVPLPVSSLPGLLDVYSYHDGWAVLTGTDTLVPGEGYWVQVTAAVTIPLFGSSSSAPLSLTYQEGWQLLGNPFDVALPLASITNGNLITRCYSFGPTWGELTPTDSLQPGRGYWILLAAPTTLTFLHP